MSFVLYYSNYCENCKNLLTMLSQSNKKDEIHFICIDNRITDRSGITNVILENGHQLILPPTVKSVPSLLLLNRGHQVVEGSEIYNILIPKKNTVEEQMNNSEPTAFQVGLAGSLTGVASDSFSFLDMSSEDLSAKGGGGIRQMHHYVSINESGNIETPPDTYVADKIESDVTVDKLRMEREKDVPSRPPAAGTFY